MLKTKLSSREAEEIEEWAELVLPWLSPPALATAAAISRSLRRAAAAVNSRRAADAARGLELYPIPFFNPTPDSRPYSYFLYCRFSFLFRPPSYQPWGVGPDIPVFDLSSLTPVASASAGLGKSTGCRCADCSVEPGCPCSGSLGGQRTGMSLVNECGEVCSCGLECVNRTTQRGIQVHLMIVRDLKKGWGLHADQVLRKGEFICEYAGEFVKIEEAKRRLLAYDELASVGDFSHALLVVREHLPSGKKCIRINIDATNVGNVARFINHSCDGGNLLVVLVRDSGSILPRLCFFAAKDISEGEELTFSYGSTCAGPNRLPCFCGKDACIGFLPSEDA